MANGTSKTYLVNHKVDSGFSWIIAVCCFIIYALIIGNLRSYGVIYVAIIDKYGVSREEASWPLSLLYAVMFFTGIISGILSNYFSSRVIVLTGCLFSSLGIALCFLAQSVFQLSLFIGLIQGFGCGLTFTQLPIIINQYFVKYRGTACGLAFAGGTVGAFLLPLVVEYLLNQFSLSGCFLILSALTLNTIPAALLLRPPINEQRNEEVLNYCTADVIDPTTEKIRESLCENIAEVEDTKDTPKEESKCLVLINQYLFTLKTLSKNPVYVTICVLHAIFMWSWTTITLVIVDFAVDRNIEKTDAVTLLSAFAGCDLLGRLSSGYVSDKGVLKRTTVAFVSTLMIGVVAVIIPLLNSYVAFAISSFIVGLFTGALVILFSVLIVEYVEMSKVPIALGVSFSFFGFVAMVNPEIIGYFRDVHRSYNGLFYGIGISCVLTALVWFIVIYFYGENKKADKCKGEVK